MIIGVVIGYYAPHVQESFETVQFGSVSVPIAIGLLLMMYPVLCKIQYEKIHIILSNRQIWTQIAISIFINWVIGPIVMTALAWACLHDLPELRTGVVMVGLARCIAMVLIWVDLAEGDSDYCAILVAINAILQIALYSPYAILFINIVPSWFGAVPDNSIHVDIWPVAQSVLIYLGIPLVAGIITRFGLRSLKGAEWYDKKFLPPFGSLALLGLLYTIIVMFANQGHEIIDNIRSVCRTAVPLLCYFVIMFFIPLFILRFFFSYRLVVTQSFTASSNNFELAIAVAIGTYGIHSEQALAATIGPLIEVPVLVVLSYIYPKRVGRKPLKCEMAAVDQTTKKRLQNRTAQKNYRERKNNLIQTLQDRIRELEESKDAQKNQLLSEISTLKRENELLKEDLRLLKEEIHSDSFQPGHYHTVKDNNVLQCAPENKEMCKTKVLNMLSQSKGAYRRIIQVHADVMSYCPGLKAEQLPYTLQRKIEYEPSAIASEEDIDNYIHCINDTYL
ncbi:hypothetical protein G6F57_000649 [Rhizopus arrhizus]|uniref:BZIP domain-containing protein n=1 Tax=Rhizopus oryzae TaxID=64495 RepID=A0A9P6XK71_RHIOR|nr:hypothetical protein G6F23_000299 [Rhizopus arrhizus]KAG1427901.1 hypothetical protein G6F58_000817 [Rhizopus delemar]KAG0768884.1 hypothetical protein G6F24_001550 [Rhizopus arrhizus]KAG0781859.1 hypothetical protein G6F22_009373 [Rhizopus arrhizus]KAG0796566.1 hypothetical protein G6F21_001210 [Rhizopus arrhizus]